MTDLKGHRLGTNHVTDASSARNTRECLAGCLAAVKRVAAWKDSCKECISVSINLHHGFPRDKGVTNRDSTPETTGVDLIPMFALEAAQLRIDRLSE